MTQYFLENYITLDPFLVEWFGVSKAKQVRKTKRKEKNRKIEVMGRAKPPTRYGRKVDLFPLWEVVDERGGLLGSLSLQSGGKARFIPRSEESSCVV